jgi:hypothetical protein
MRMAGRENDRITVAKIAGTAARHARPATLSSEQEQAAIIELGETAAGRSDLLAQYAGLAIGLHEGDYDHACYLRAAQLCIRAGADTSLMPQWITEGQRRAQAIRERHRRLRQAADAGPSGPPDEPMTAWPRPLSSALPN